MPCASAVANSATSATVVGDLGPESQQGWSVGSVERPQRGVTGASDRATRTRHARAGRQREAGASGLMSAAEFTSLYR